MPRVGGGTMIGDGINEPPRLIFITGFMGAGKTTIARELARLLNYHAIDLDELITDRQNRTPGEIIEQSGEDEFRRIETETLRQILSEQAGDSAGNVIALGGGAWIAPENRRLIDERQSSTVWLDAPFELCWQRIEASGTPRPLGRTREVAAQRYRERLPAYSLAQIRIMIGLLETTTEIVRRIKTALT